MRLFTFGCSYTEGQGLSLPMEQPYTYILAEKLQIEYYNFGSSGMSNDYIFRKVFELINSNVITKEDILVIQWTHYIRKELQFKHNDKNYYHIAPYGYFPFRDKIINPKNKIVVSEYSDMIKNVDEEHGNIEKMNKNFLDEYNLKMLHVDYQMQTSSNYIKGLYSFLELNNYKHLHFFGWDDCILPIDYDKILKTSFGGYTNVIGKEHPTQNGHILWANYLYEKIIELNIKN